VRVESTPESVWTVITDVSLVASWVTVVDDVWERESLSAYDAVLADRVGPFKLSADLDVDVVEVDEPTAIRVRADGEDRQVASRIQIDATVALSSVDRGTEIHVSGMYEVTGKVATLGASMIRAKGEKILDEFFGSLEGHFV
jgi:carbon monoxide dehydrogenase subunit G